ncbi:MAG: hypothetical protein WBA54_12325 [Acidaminobacteraceae bacterium]
MTTVLAVFLILAGLFFISLGMLFINYKLSPLKMIVNREDVFVSFKLGFQIILPGFVLLFISILVFKS